MTQQNGASGHVHLHPPVFALTAKCPLCATELPRKRYEEILKIAEARDTALAEERASIEQREQHLEHVVRDAVSAEQARWSQVAGDMQKRVDELETAHEAALQRMQKMHERSVATEVRRREITERRLARDREVFRKQVERERELRDWVAKRFEARRDEERAAAEARANAMAERRIKESEARIRAERLAMREEQKELVAGLKAEIQTVERRRRTEEATMKETIAVLQKRAEQRDRHHLGPEGEEQLVNVLRESYPGDQVEHRGKGGDVVHHVIDRGHDCGLIVYECKNGLSWDASFIKQTARAAELHKTSFAILCARTLPRKQPVMFCKNGIVVVVPEIVSAVAGVMRDGIVAIARMSAGIKDREVKESALVSYLGSSEFATSIRLVATKIDELTRSLEREKSAHGSTWASREANYFIDPAGGGGHRRARHRVAPRSGNSRDQRGVLMRTALQVMLQLGLRRTMAWNVAFVRPVRTRWCRQNARTTS